MNILIDGRIWSLYSAGVGTFFTSAILEWARQSDEDTFYIILPKGLDARYELPSVPDNIVLLDYSRRFPRRLPNIIVLQLLVPYLCRKLHINFYYAPVPHLPYCIPHGVKTMVTVHDVVNIEMAHTMSWTNRLATSFFFGQAIRKADYLWTNSHYTKSKIETYYPKRHCQLIFVGDSVDHHFFYPKNLTEAERQEVRQKHGIRERFLLFVGSLEPRKNLEFLLHIIPSLYKEHQIQLVVVGGKGWKNSSLRAIIEAPDFPRESTIFCGFITNTELADLYNVADCYISAAFMEGFGMPQLEALKCGCPVITSHNTAMIEVAQGKSGATTVKGYQPETWKQVVLKVLDEHPKVNQQELQEYDWKEIIGRLLNYIPHNKDNSK